MDSTPQLEPDTTMTDSASLESIESATILDSTAEPILLDSISAPAASLPEPTASTSAPTERLAPIASTSLSPPALPTPPAPVAEAAVITFVSTSPTGKTRSWFAKYYLPSSSNSTRSPFQDLPESYFNPTSFELQGAVTGMERKRVGLIDAPLRTENMREKEAAGKTREKVGRWPQTRIRIRFGDRSLLEGIFKSTESMLAIYEFVRFALEEKYQGVPFVLYQTPPKTEYKKGDPALKGKNLMDLQFTPSSVFYIKFDDESLNTSSTPPLLASILAGAAELPIPPPLEVPTSTAGDKGAEEAEKKPKLGANGKIMPNWLKKAKTGKN